MKKFIAFLLAVLMVLPMVACANNQGEGSESKKPVSSSGSASSGGTVDVGDDDDSFLAKLRKYRDTISDGIPDVNGNGETVTIDCLHDENGKCYTADWIMKEEYTSDQINNALYERHLTIEDRFKVNLEYTYLDDSEYINARVTLIRAGLGDIDIMGVAPWAPQIMLEGVFEDLNEYEYLKFESPWWFTDIINDLTLDGHTTLVYGAVTPISIFGGTEVCHFNLDFCENYNIEDLYQVVRDGRWDYEYAKKLTADYYFDVDGVEGMTAGDIYGIKWGNMQRKFWAFGGYYTEFSDDGVPTGVYNNDKIADIFEKCKVLTSYYEYTPTGGEGGDGVDGLWFEDGRMLMFITNLTLRENSDWDFKAGMLPLPKLDEHQENYIAPGYFTGAAIPIDATNPSISALVLEALAYYGWYSIVPTYYENIVKYKYSDDQRNAEMLDLMFNNFQFDPVWVYNKLSVDLVQTYCQSTSGGFASFIKSKGAKEAKSYRNNVSKLRTTYGTLFK